MRQKLAKMVGAPLRLRLTLWTMGVALIIELVLGSVIYYAQYHEMDGVFTDRLRHRSLRIASSLEKSDEPVTDELLRRIASEPMNFPRLETFLVASYDRDGKLAASTRTPAPKLEDLGYPRVLGNSASWCGRVRVPEVTQDGKADEMGRVLITRQFNSRGERQVLVLATSDALFEEMMSVGARLLLLMLPVGLIGSGGAAWVISGLAIAPLRQLRDMTQALAPETIRQEMPIPSSASELQAFRDDLADARRRLADAFKAQDRLISNVSHELKTPIAVILTQAETIGPDTMSQAGKEFISSVRQEMRRLGRTVDSFVMLTRLRAGSQLAERQHCPVHDILIEAARGCAAVAVQRAVLLRTLLSESAEPPVVTGDADLLRMMMDHLLRHTIHCSPRGQEVVIRVTIADGRCRLIFRDQGDMLASGRMATLFDRFPEDSQVSQPRQDLGLSIAQGIAELHGGRVLVANAEGGGCEFTVDLPVGVMEDDTPKTRGGGVAVPAGA